MSCWSIAQKRKRNPKACNIKPSNLMPTLLDEPVKFSSFSLPSLFCLSQMCLHHKSSATTFLFILCNIEYIWAAVAKRWRWCSDLRHGLSLVSFQGFICGLMSIQSPSELHKRVKTRLKWKVTQTLFILNIEGYSQIRHIQVKWVNKISFDIWTFQELWWISNMNRPHRPQHEALPDPSFHRCRCEQA